MHVEPQRSIQARATPCATTRARRIHAVIALVSHHCCVPIPAVLGASRDSRPIARARQLAMYLAHVILGETLTSIGQAFGRDRTTVSYACGLIEDMRDDATFDAEVSALEFALQNEER